MVVAESLDNAKELWDEYVKTHEKIQYSWNKAVKAVKYHHGGYMGKMYEVYAENEIEALRIAEEELESDRCIPIADTHYDESYVEEIEE